MKFKFFSPVQHGLDKTLIIFIDTNTYNKQNLEGQSRADDCNTILQSQLNWNFFSYIVLSIYTVVLIWHLIMPFRRSLLQPHKIQSLQMFFWQCSTTLLSTKFVLVKWTVISPEQSIMWLTNTDTQRWATCLSQNWYTPLLEVNQAILAWSF